MINFSRRKVDVSLTRAFVKAMRKMNEYEGRKDQSFLKKEVRRYEANTSACMGLRSRELVLNSK
jgi:hypothetical protein